MYSRQTKISTNYFFILVFLLLTLTACKEETTPNNANNTPLSLQENNRTSYEIKSKWNYEDIIEKLYNEALSNDEDLKTLDDAIKNINEQKPDSLNDYNKYINTNYNFWRLSETYIGRIQDSTLKHSASQLFTGLQSKHDSTLTPLREAHDLATQKSIEMNDKSVLLKALVAHSLFKKYQENEEPSLKPITNINTEYDNINKLLDGQLDELNP